MVCLWSITASINDLISACNSFNYSTQTTIHFAKGAYIQYLSVVLYSQTFLLSGTLEACDDFSHLSLCPKDWITMLNIICFQIKYIHLPPVT